MDPKDVRLKASAYIKAFAQVVYKQEGFWPSVFIFFLWLCGLAMALNVPTFMMGPISNFIMTFILSLLFGAIFLGIIVGLIAWHDELGGDYFRTISREYKEAILPLQKAELEKVDDILLK